MIHQIKAAAGSGKTYLLAQHFIKLLLAGKQPLQTLHSILAITFTNKAAIEMKTRIISWLKRLILEGIIPDSPLPDFPLEKAKSLTRAILHNYQALNIRTIDSLLNQLLKSMALEAGLPPDFKITFLPQDLLDPAYDAFLYRAEQGNEGQLLQELLETRISLQNDSGFWISRKVKTDVHNMVNELYKHKTDLSILSRTDLETELDKISTELRQEVQNFYNYLSERKIDLKKPVHNALEKVWTILPPSQRTTSAYLQKADLTPCVLKKDHHRLKEADHVLYRSLCTKIKSLQKKYIIYHLALLHNPVLKVAREVVLELEKIQREKGLVWGNVIPQLTQKIFSENLFSEAMFRLGANIRHLLIDEFQDTSADQWQALRPLVLESFSQGGSLFFVGDIKQSIYGWRGARPELFDDIVNDQELLSICPDCQQTTLDTNWRSVPDIVSFNNNFFSKLSQDQSCLQFICRDCPARTLTDFYQQLKTTFSHVRQQIPLKHKQLSGLVSCRFVPGENNEGFREELSKQLLEFLENDLLLRRAPGEIAILVRNNTEAELVSTWLAARQIHVVTENSLSLFAQPLVQELMSFLHFINNPDDDLALAGILYSHNIFLPFAGQEAKVFSSWLCEQNDLSRRQTKGIDLEEGLLTDIQGRGLWQQFARDFPELWQTLLAPLLVQGKLKGPYELTCFLLDFFQVSRRLPKEELTVLRFLELLHLAELNGTNTLAQFLDMSATLGKEEKLPCPDHVPAVRISTIHKAKGLDFPVVITPFLDWRNNATKDFLLIRDQGRTFCLPAKRELAPEYYRHRLQKLLEDLNLLYVAWTRPREELHIFLPQKEKNPIAKLIKNIFQDSGLSIEQDWTLGCLQDTPPRRTDPTPALKAAHQETISAEQSRSRGHSPALKLFHQLQTKDPELDPYALRGQFIHRILELLARTGLEYDDLTRAWQRACQEISTCPCALEELIPIWKWITSQTDLKEYFTKGQPEQQFACNGKIFRLDLCHISKKRAVAIEFKTGQPVPEHKTQMRHYLNILQQHCNNDPGQDRKKIQGLLVYLDRQEIITIAPKQGKTGQNKD